jgi:hypothetical protein
MFSASGATLAEPQCTSTALSPFDVSAMDGYAVRGNGPWILRPDIQVAGTNLAGPLRQGEAIRIGTGARVPAGSTTVIRDEYVTATTIVGKPGIAHRPDTSTAIPSLWPPSTSARPWAVLSSTGRNCRTPNRPILIRRPNPAR